MKRLFLLAICVVFAAGAANAQEVFRKGDLVFNLGVGIGNTLYSGSGFKMTVPPLSLSGDYAVVDNLINGNNGSITVGGYLAYTANKQEFLTGTQKYGFRYSDLIIGVRGAFHYQFVRNLDTYAGLMIGYDIASAKQYGTWIGTPVNASASAVSFGGYIGARYFFSPKFGVFAELGYGIAYLTLGVTYKI